MIFMETPESDENNSWKILAGMAFGLAIIWGIQIVTTGNWLLVIDWRWIILEAVLLIICGGLNRRNTPVPDEQTLR